jgi:hypothetical protein
MNNRNMMIGGVVAIVVVVILVVVFVLGGGDDEDSDGGDGLTSEAMTSAFEAILAGDPEPAKALTCDAEQANVDETAEALSGLADAGVEAEVSCSVDGDTASCDLTVAGETQTISWEVVDDKVCQRIAE